MEVCKRLKQKSLNMLIKLKNRIQILNNRKGLKFKDFTIISNNCWGGDVYKMFGLKYRSPTIGLFFYESDYVKFVSDIKKYLSAELIFITPKESRFYSKLMEEFGEKKLEFPIARLLDIEVMFLHYNSREEALIKWNRRRKRVNYERILYKLSDRTDFSEEIAKIFSNMDLPNKVCFIKEKYSGVEGIVVEELNALPIGVSEKDCTMKYINIKKLINGIKSNI